MSHPRLPKTFVAILIVASGLLFVRRGSSANATAAVASSNPYSITTTLLPEIATRMLREQQVAPLAFARLTSIKNHPGDTHDCLSCHGPSSQASLPKDHTKAKDHEAWTVESCVRCHLRESNLENPKTNAVSINLADNGYCASCHGNSTLKKTFPDGKSPTSLFVSREQFGGSVHGKLKLPCVGCHRIGNFPHEKLPYRTSRELARRIERESCMECHRAEAEQFRKSVHGRLYVDKQSADAPGCTDCHGSHATSKTRETAFRMGMTDTCGGCHSNPTLTAKYDLSPDVVSNYKHEFHGVSIQLTRSQGTNVASNKPVCHDCHGAHDISKTNEPASRVAKTRLVLVCQKCHEKAGPKFADAWVGHANPSLKKAPIVYFTQLSYKLLIPAVMGQFGLYMLLDVLRAGLNRKRKGRRQ